MPKSKLVRISYDTIQKLGKISKPFESPNDCINRILTECETKSKQVSGDKIAISEGENLND